MRTAAPWLVGTFFGFFCLAGAAAVGMYHQPAGCPANTITLPAEASAPLDELYELAAKSTTDDIDWDIVPPAPASPKRFEHALVLHLKTPGTYTVSARVVSTGKIVKATTKVTVLAPAPVPTPTPPPPPPIPGPPGPVAKLYLVVIENTDVVAATRAAYWTDPTLTAYLKAHGMKPALASRQTIDSATGKPPPDLVPYLTDAAAQVAKGKQYPRCYVVDEDGHPRYEDDLPATPAALLDLLKKFGG